MCSSSIHLRPALWLECATVTQTWLKLPLLLQESFYGRRIVFSGAAEDVNEPTLLQLFAKYGDIASDVKGLFLVRSALGLPSGCGYVTLASAEQAAAAAKALNGAADCAETGGKLNLLIVQLHPPSSNHDDNINTVVASTSISVAGPHKDSRTVGGRNEGLATSDLSVVCSMQERKAT